MRKKLKLDPSAPRYRPEFTKVLNRTMWRRFFRENPQFKPFKHVYSYQQLTDLLKNFHLNITKLAIDNRDGVLLPERLGWIFLSSIKKPKRTVNEKLSNELGYDIGYSNNHTDGKLLKINYRSAAKAFNFENKDLWKFYPAQNFQDKASKAFSEKYMLYIVAEDIRAIKGRENDFYKRENIEPPKFKKFKRR